MLQNQRFLVVHKPTPKEPPEYYGPFVSERRAKEYAEDHLPDGINRIRPLNPRPH